MKIRRYLPQLPPRGSFAARALGTFALAAATAAGVVTATSPAAHAQGTANYNYTTLDNGNDLTFNQLLGIDNAGVIAGYFGSGVAQHPNKGYYLLPPHYSQLDYRVENFPGSNQTQVTGLNNGSVEVGFQSPTNTGTDANYGWYSLDNGRTFTQVNVPLPSGFSPNSPAVTQLLGVNDHDMAVGFENDSNNNAHGFVYSIHSNRAVFTNISGSSSVTDAAINNGDQVAGFYTPAPGGTQSVEGFLATSHGITSLAFPGASSTMALGLNNNGEVVGVYTTGSGSTAQNFGFTWAQKRGFTTIDDPDGMGMTTVNGVNDRGELVGFFVDANTGFTHGMLVTPASVPMETVTTNTPAASTTTSTTTTTTTTTTTSGTGGPTTASWSLQKATAQ